MITNHRKRNTVNIRVGGHVITSKPVIKYLGVMIDAKINFKGHLDYAYEKAANTSVSLARMMSNNRPKIQAQITGGRSGSLHTIMRGTSSGGSTSV